MDIRLLALDIDDTLVDIRSLVSARTLRALKRAQAQGVEIVLATGRGYLGTQYIRRQLGEGFRYIICFGGSLVADYGSGEPIIQRFLSEEDVALCLRLGEELGVHCQIYQGNEVVFPQANAFTEQYCRIQGLPWREDPHLAEHDLQGVPKVLLYVSPEREAECFLWIEKRLPGHLHGLLSKPGFIEIGNKDVTKGTALAALAGKLSVLQEQTAAVGDNTLDLDMIKWAGIGCCVANGNESVKREADMILPAQSEEGVAWFIERYILQDSI